jgi:ribosome-associated translation inhibitor RaiA
MEILVQFVQTENNASAEGLCRRKLESLSLKYDWVIRADVFFKEEKETNGKGKICDIRLSAPGPRIHAASDEASFEAAVAETIRDLEIQLAKRKSTLIKHS